MGLTAAQLLERRAPHGYLGGTDMAGLVGMSKWATPLTVWLEKRSTEPLAPDDPSVMMSMGTLLEPVVAGLFETACIERPELPEYTAAEPHYPRLLEDGSPAALRDPERPWLGGHPDRMLWLPGGSAPGAVLECKWGEDRRLWGPSGGDEVPPGYRIQLLHYLGFTGMAVGYVAVLLSYGDFRWYRIERDEPTISLLRDIGDEYWHTNVLEGEPPDLDGSESYSQWLAARYDAMAGSTAVATPEQQLLASQLEQARRELLRLEQVHNEAEQRLQLSMGALEQLELPDGQRIAWREQKGNMRTDWKAVAQGLSLGRHRKLERLVAELTTRNKPSRPFRVPWPTTLKALQQEQADGEEQQ